MGKIKQIIAQYGDTLENTYPVTLAEAVMYYKDGKLSSLKEYLDELKVEATGEYLPLPESTLDTPDYLVGVKTDNSETYKVSQIPAKFLPSYVDDVIEGTLKTFPKKGETGKIYVDTNTNLSYRWTGSIYVEIGKSTVLNDAGSLSKPVYITGGNAMPCDIQIGGRNYILNSISSVTYSVDNTGSWVFGISEEFANIASGTDMCLSFDCVNTITSGRLRLRCRIAGRGSGIDTNLGDFIASSASTKYTYAVKCKGVYTGQVFYVENSDAVGSLTISNVKLELGNQPTDWTPAPEDIITTLNSAIDLKQDNITGAATTIVANNLTTNRVVVSDNSGKIAVSDITSTELNYLNDVTSNIQIQLNGKAAASHTHNYLPLTGGILTGDVSLPIEKASLDSSLPVSGATMNITDIVDLKNYKTYLGSYTHSGIWYNIISIRHRNGANDGGDYGMYIRSPLTNIGNLTWGKQYKPTLWQDERTILDSSNYTSYCTPANIGASVDGHTHNYAGSSSAGGSATSAVKLDTSAGSATQPIYFSGGKPVATTYTLGKSVPSNAVFTDTTYSNFVKSGSNAKAGLVPAPSTTAGTTKYLREDGTWVVPSDTKVTQTASSADAEYPLLASANTAPNGTATTTIYNANIKMNPSAGSITATAFYQTSDINKKDIHGDINLSIEDILSIPTIEFNYKEDDKTHIGTIAQEVEKVCPEIVQTDNEGFKSVDYAKLSVLAIKALKDTHKELSSLKEEVEQIKALLHGKI